MSGEGAVDAAARFLRATGALGPSGGIDVGIIAGSGLSEIGERLESPQEVDYERIPGWPIGSVEGHAGRLVFGRLSDARIGLARGRVHLYEGRTPSELVFGVRVLAQLGARTLVVTNAAGGLDPRMKPGDLMIIRDHIALPALSGLSPLVGPNDVDLGPRFPGMIGAYDRALSAAAFAAAEEAGFGVHHGVYAMVGGPAFETPAEARFLRSVGADAVGMSTAPEVIAARHMGMRVVGLSLITNMVVQNDHATQTKADLHSEVLEVGASAVDRIASVLVSVVDASSRVG